MKIQIHDQLPDEVVDEFENRGLELGKTYALPTPQAQPLVNAGFASYADPTADVEEHEDFRVVTMGGDVTEGRERYEKGKSYSLPESLAFYFVGAGWADVEPKNAKKPRSLATPKDAREPLTKEERAARDEIIARQQVQTVRAINTGDNEVWKGDPFEFPEGEYGRVVDAQTGEDLTPEHPKAREAREQATTLDVQDVHSDSNTQI